jgi:hypothetical protein
MGPQTAGTIRRTRPPHCRAGDAVKTKTYFSFRVDVWDDAGDSIVEHVAGIDDFHGTSSTKISVPLGSSWQLLQKSDAVPFSLCIMRTTTLSISSRVVVRHGFFEDFQLLRDEVGEKHGQPSDVSAGMGEACHMPDADGVGMGGEDDGDRFGRL